MHVLQITSAAIKAALYKMHIGPVVPVMELRIDSLTYTGNVVSSTYSDIQLFVTDRLASDLGITLSRYAPYLPASGEDSLIEAGEISFDLLNPEGVFAVTQDGAILSPSRIEQAKVYLRAFIEEANDDLDIFTGRIASRPTEKMGRIKFRALSTLMDAVAREVVFERFPGSQTTNAVEDELTHTTVEITGNRGSFHAFDAITCFDSEGNPRVSFENDEAETGGITRILLKNQSKIGRYKIEFLNETGFRITHPNSTIAFGNTGSVFDNEYLTIYPTWWSGTKVAGQIIEFQTYVTYCGNPGTIIKNLIEKGLRENYGDVPTFNGLPVQWGTFNDIENRFRGYTVYVSETNPNNDVFVGGGKPLSYIQLAQRVADHIHCTIYDTEDGQLAIRSPYIYEDIVGDLSDSYAISEMEITGPESINYAIFQYGRDDREDDYAAEQVLDLRSTTTDLRKEKEFALPYFKLGVSDNSVRAFVDLMRRRFLENQFGAKTRLSTQFALTLQPGDRCRLISAQQPVGIGYFQAVNTSKTIMDGSFKNGTVDWVAIQEPEGEPALLDGFEVGGVPL